MPTVYFSLGSNLGDRLANLNSALNRLNSGPVKVTWTSSIYETEHIGDQPEPDYLNCVASCETDLPPLELLNYTQNIERDGGRVPTHRWGPRAIDIDMILYGDVTMDSELLTLPHPRMLERAFVLIPLYEIEPQLMLPGGHSLEAAIELPGLRNQRIRLIEPRSHIQEGLY